MPAGHLPMQKREKRRKLLNVFAFTDDRCNEWTNRWTTRELARLLLHLCSRRERARSSRPPPWYWTKGHPPGGHEEHKGRFTRAGGVRRPGVIATFSVR